MQDDARSHSSEGSAQQDASGAANLLGRSGFLLAMVAALLLGFIATLIYSLQVHPTLRVLAVASLFAGASAAVGGLFGLLFGVPRTTGSEGQSSAAGVGVTARSGIEANTNLEQISDWLTKIIVGVGLTQLGTIKDGASRLFGSMGPVLGGPPYGTAVAGAIIIYFWVLGFFSGWMYSRLRLGLEMTRADRMLALSRRAKNAGDPVTAEAAKTAAAATIRMVAPVVPPAPRSSDMERLASRYEELRATLPSGPRRTALMEDLVWQARQLAQSAPITLQDARGSFQIGTEGRRIIALGLMEGNIAVADLSTVLQAISEPLSAFEQYHALYVANSMVSSLVPNDRAQLKLALQASSVRDRIGDDTSRRLLADQILARL